MSELKKRLDDAVRQVSTARARRGPGHWEVWSDDDGVYLEYIVYGPFRAPTPTEPFGIWRSRHADPDEPWTVWGGNKILKIAGVEVVGSGTCISHRDGVEEYHDWVRLGSN